MKSQLSKIVASLLLAGAVGIGIAHNAAAQNEAPKHLGPAAIPANVSWPLPTPSESS